MVFCVERDGVEPSGMLRVCCGTDPSRLMPDVSKLSEGAFCLLLYKRTDRVPHACRVKRLPNGGCEKRPKVKMSANALDLRLRDLVLDAES